MSRNTWTQYLNHRAQTQQMQVGEEESTAAPVVEQGESCGQRRQL